MITTLSYKQDTLHSPELIREAFLMVQHLEKFSYLIADLFEDDFAMLDEMQANTQQQRRDDSVDDLPF